MGIIIKSTSSTAGQDYNAVTQTLVLNSVTTIDCINVPIIDDTDVEAIECFSVSLSGTQTGLTLNPATTQVCIIDNDRMFSSQTVIPYILLEYLSGVGTTGASGAGTPP